MVAGILRLLMWARRAAVALILAWLVLILWLAARRAGRKGLELAVPLIAMALVVFSAAVLTPRPPMTEGLAVGLVLFAAFLVAVSIGLIVWSGVRQRKPPAVVDHSGPPWEDESW